MLGPFHSEKDVWEGVSAFQCEAGTGCALGSHAVAGVALSTVSAAALPAVLGSGLLILCWKR